MLATGVLMSWESLATSSFFSALAFASASLAFFSSSRMMSKLSVKAPNRFPLSISRGISRLPPATLRAKSFSCRKGLTTARFRYIPYAMQMPHCASITARTARSMVRFPDSRISALSLNTMSFPTTRPAFSMSRIVSLWATALLTLSLKSVSVRNRTSPVPSSTT